MAVVLSRVWSDSPTGTPKRRAISGSVRISAFAEMRRYMIDYGVLLRHRDGTGYWLNPDF